MQPFS